MISSTAMILIVDDQCLRRLLVPLVITNFFECGGAAVIAEGQGGLRGAIVGRSAARGHGHLGSHFWDHAYPDQFQNWLFVFGGTTYPLCRLLLSYWGCSLEVLRKCLPISKELGRF